MVIELRIFLGFLAALIVLLAAYGARPIYGKGGGPHVEPVPSTVVQPGTHKKGR